VEGYGSVQLTDTARPILKGEEQLTLRKMVKATKNPSRKTRAFSGAANNTLWDALREHRKALATEQSIPAYMIFHDATLAEMTERQPQTLEQLGRISGIGERKLDAYGQGFLDVILANAGTDNEQNDGINDTAANSISLLKQGNTVEDIATQRKLSLNTIYNHLCQGIANSELSLNDVIDLDEAQIKEIQFAFELSEDGKLKTVFESLDGEYDYTILKCVKASLSSS
jgi:ATP-dependent DNA helicase RecQ